jgi:hypothetical protein
MESWEHSSGCCPSFTFLADVVHASELFVSGVGMGALERVRSSGAPLLVLLGDQPEQARNVAELVLRSPGFALREVLVGDPGCLGGGVRRARARGARRQQRPAGARCASASGVLTRGGVATSAAGATTPAHPRPERWHGCCSCFRP